MDKLALIPVHGLERKAPALHFSERLLGQLNQIRELIVHHLCKALFLFSKIFKCVRKSWGSRLGIRILNLQSQCQSSVAFGQGAIVIAFKTLGLISGTFTEQIL